MLWMKLNFVYSSSMTDKMSTDLEEMVTLGKSKANDSQFSWLYLKL